MTDEEFEEFVAVAMAYGEKETEQDIATTEKNIALMRDERINKMTKDITETLDQREGRYGEYVKVAATAQQLKETLRGGASWNGMEAYMQESLDLIANKLARIVNGDPFYDDSWHDVGGYAKLVEIELNKGK
jgi:nucleoid-associated protein YejK